MNWREIGYVGRETPEIHVEAVVPSRTGQWVYRTAWRAGLCAMGGNRLPYFSLTREVTRERANGNGRPSLEQVGCELEEENVPVFLRGLHGLHLSCVTGEPLHAQENGWHFLRDARRSGQFKGVARHLRVSVKEAEALAGLTRDQFDQFVDAQRVRWMAEAATEIHRWNLKLFGDRPETLRAWKEKENVS